MLGSIGMPELLVIIVIALIIFGPGKLPDAGRAIGEAIRGFKKALTEPGELPPGKLKNRTKREGPAEPA
jgi:sec-independent protein translocase protein TatA